VRGTTSEGQREGYEEVHSPVGGSMLTTLRRGTAIFKFENVGI
jgi:hypothetical protein